MPQTRRDFLQAGLALAALSRPLPSFAATRGRVVVVGGGYGGATVARYLRRLGGEALDITLVERESAFVSCPMSNLVVAGIRELDGIVASYAGLERSGVRRVQGEAVAIDPVSRNVELAGGARLGYDRLILSPGIDFIWEELPSLGAPEAQARIPHAWHAGPQTLALRRQLEAMPDGGVFVIHVPRMPYRCAPAPYERACLVADYFAKRKPRSKLIVLDANAEVQSKKDLFTAAWSGRYKGIVEYRPESELIDVDPKTLTAKLQFEDVRADVLNVIPPQRAGAIARQLGMANANARFCQVDFLTYESTVQSGIHILGDSIQTAPLMAKAGQMANRQARVCAAAVVALLAGQEVDPAPAFANVCYSFIDEREAGHIASMHRYDAAQRTMLIVPGSIELSVTPSAEEALAAEAWWRRIRGEMLG